ncbi:MAG: glutathione S-transferase N-terminal domain-containing protein [Candidatus Manganitrophaceae bacterium]
MKLYQHPASPFCIGIAAILKWRKIPHEIMNIPYSDRRIVVEKTEGKYYRVPLLEDGETVVWDRTPFGQEIARYLDQKFNLALFPPHLEGIQAILSRYIENDLEAIGFKLNDIHYRAWLSDLYDRTMFIRHKERKFGDGCLDEWQQQKDRLQETFESLLAPLDQMLQESPFLIDRRPRFVDFNLLGILGNYLFSGQNTIPTRFKAIEKWKEGIFLASPAGI